MPYLTTDMQDGDTPLLKAVRNRNFEIMQVLLEKGSKVSACDKVLNECCLSVCQSVCLSACLSVCLFVCLSAGLSICLL